MGGTKTTTKYANPYQDLLNSVMAGGLPSVAKGYMENVAIPTTMNASTAMGLGRSGGAQEAVAQAAWAPGVDIMKTILGLGAQPVSSTSKQDPGALGWMGGLLGLGGSGMDLYNKWPKSKPSTTDNTDWLGKLFGYDVPEYRGGYD